MAEPVANMTELVLRYQREADYRIVIRDLGAPVTIAAVHGGGIDPLTSELATAIAAADANLYALEGIRASDNGLLRIPAASFDDMRLLALLQRSRLALSLLGAPDAAPLVRLGGRNRRLVELLKQQLAAAKIAVHPPQGAAAHHPGRFYNQSTEGGVQIELSLGLRQAMVSAPLQGTAWPEATWQAPLRALVERVRAAVQQYLAETRDDVGSALRAFDETTPAVKRAWRAAAKPEGDGHDA